MANDKAVTLLPDAGPLITLAYADALNLLLKPGWSVALVDMVQHEVMRNETPTSARIASWVSANSIPVRRRAIALPQASAWQRALSGGPANGYRDQ
jgi:hypothetical protein